MSKSFFLLLLFLSSVFFSACESTQVSEIPQKTPFELAKEIDFHSIKYLFLIELLENEFPNNDELLSEDQIKEIYKARIEYLKENYYYDYFGLMKAIKQEFDSENIVLNELEKKELFPEQSIGTTFSCSGIEVASFFPDSFSADGIIKANLSPSKDKVSVKINSDDTISFLTAASVEFGSTDPAIWEILENDEIRLVAQDITSSFTDTFILLKESGDAYWQDTNTNDVILYGAMNHLKCISLDN